MKTVGVFWNTMFILIEHNWHAQCKIKENSMKIVYRNVFNDSTWSRTTVLFGSHQQATCFSEGSLKKKTKHITRTQNPKRMELDENFKQVVMPDVTIMVKC